MRIINRQTKGIQESALKILKYSPLNCGRIVGIVFCRLLMVFVNHGFIEENSNMPQPQKSAFKPCFLLHLQPLKVKVTNASKLAFQGHNLKELSTEKVFLLNSDLQALSMAFNTLVDFHNYFFLLP